MKKVWQIIRNHFREDYDHRTYLTTAVFLATCIALNYTYRIEDQLSSLTGVTRLAAYLCFYSTSFYLPLLFSFRSKDWFSWPFLFKSLFALLVLSLDSSHAMVRDVVALVDPQLQYWFYKVIVNLMSMVTVLLPILVYYFTLEKQDKTVYGLAPSQIDAGVYLQMLAVMLPVLVAASFLPSFLRQYPMYKSSQAHHFLSVGEWVTVAGYEVAYGLDFITVELFFRGFMVLGLTSFLGRRSVLPMAVTYCFLHFGKPAGEAVSSVVGGYILGALAYETRSIWGGIIVHVGVAWLMEIVSYLRKQ